MESSQCSGRNAGFQALVRKKSPHIIWTNCTLHTQAHESRNLCEKLQTIYETVIRVNCVRNSPMRGRLFAKLCDDTEAEHTALLSYCDTRWLYHV
jgi:hypothetical protein